MVTTWEQIIIHISSTLGQDIGSELRNRTPIVLPKPTIPQAAQDKHNDLIARHKKAKERLLAAKTKAKANVDTLLAAAQDLQTINTLSVQQAELENDCEQLEYEVNNPPSIELHGEEKAEYDGAWKAYNSREANLKLHRGQAFSIVLGQCTQTMKDQMKHHSDYTTVPLPESI